MERIEVVYGNKEYEMMEMDRNPFDTTKLVLESHDNYSNSSS